MSFGQTLLKERPGQLDSGSIVLECFLKDVQECVREMDPFAGSGKGISMSNHVSDCHGVNEGHRTCFAHGEMKGIIFSTMPKIFAKIARLIQPLPPEEDGGGMDEISLEHRRKNITAKKRDVFSIRESARESGKVFAN